jgi:hypothetical protein
MAVHCITYSLPEILSWITMESALLILPCQTSTDIVLKSTLKPYLIKRFLLFNINDDLSWLTYAEQSDILFSGTHCTLTDTDR